MIINRGKVKGIVNKYIKSDIDRFFLVLLFFSLPFDKTPSFELYSTTIKASAVIGLIIIVRTAYLIISKKIKIENNIIYKLMLGFILWMVLLLPESINFARAINFVVLNSYVIFMAISVSLIFKKEYIKPIIIAVLSSAVLVSALAIIQYFADFYNVPNSLVGLSGLYTKGTFGFARPNSFFAEPLYLASYMSLPFIICLALFFSKESHSNRKLITLLLFIFGLIILMTLSRGGIFGVALAIVFVVEFGLKRKIFDGKKIIIFILIATLGLVVSQIIINNYRHQAGDYTLGKQGSGAYLQQLTDITNRDNDERKLSRDNSVNNIKRQPIILLLGLGPAQYGPYMTNNELVNGRWLNLNNLPLALMQELGLLGLVVVAMTFIIIESRLTKYLKNEEIDISKIFALALAGYFVAQAISYQTYSTLYIIHVWACAGVAIGLTLKTAHKNT